MKRLLIIVIFLSTAISLSHAQAQFEIPLTVTDNVGGAQQLFFGVDPAGTDGIDASLGEVALPPAPITGVFDARFVGEDIGVNIDQGLVRDYRQGTVSTTGDRIHELKYQVGTGGTTINIAWNMPSWAVGTLNDIITGELINVPMSGSGNYTVTNPGGFPKLKLTVTYTAPLPVQLVSFTGSIINQQGHIRLDWRTLTETNNYGFNVQKSSTGQLGTYQTISELIPGHGTTLEPHDYTWTDLNPSAGTWYYRLEQIDSDGVRHYSEGIIPSGATGVKEQLLPKEFGLNQNYPNPFNPATIIGYALPRQSNVKIDVYNLLGQHVATLVDAVKPAGIYTAEFNAHGFSSGLYFYKMTADGNVNFLKKMVLMK